ncbi:MAG: tRNA lysidine(34) synthetase TilS [Alphaproteobacteria bacterium]|nr:tRNA lysidine(34) synthetase TilS [Alphaproteobacteria bacterium]
MTCDSASERTPAALFSDEDLRVLFDRLKKYSSILVAVSGGADSVALLHLLVRWAKDATDAPQIEAATIDHNLRPESKTEAAWVAALAARIGVGHTVARWDGDKPLTGRQAAARDARYRLLGDIVEQRALPQPTALVTAHTQDDQGETFLMRLVRGSGIDGLSAMDEARPLTEVSEDLTLERPLLGVPKSRLEQMLQAVGQSWLDDPSNASLEFERIQVRQALHKLADLGVTQEALALSAQRAGRARRALEQATETFVTAAVTLNNGAFAEVAWSDFRALADDIQIRVLLRLIDGFGGSAASAELLKIEALHNRLATGIDRTATLGGCIISRNADTVQIYREEGRVPLPAIKVAAGDTAEWDQRFHVSVSSEHPESNKAVTVRALGRPGFAALRPQLEAGLANMPAAAAATLPSFWHGDELLAVPTLHIGGGPSPPPESRSEDPPGRHGVCSGDYWAAFIGVR